MVRSLKSAKKMRKKKDSSKKGASSSSAPNVSAKVWQPGVDKLEEGEELQCDPSAYNYLRAFDIGWPCLSFDILRDSLGLIRTEFPHTIYGVAGTQAEKASWNYISLYKLSNIVGKKRDLVPKPSKDDDDDDNDDSDMESESSSDEEDEDDSNKKSQPVLKLQKVAHEGCVNRIRSMSQTPHICAAWSEEGYVQVWDLSSLMNRLAESEAEKNNAPAAVHNLSPVIRFRGHKTEGFALDWSPIVAGRLLSGACNSRIHLWEPSSGTWNVDMNAFVGHSASVEDLQWSPTEPDVFASCSVDKKIAIWDVRIGRAPAISIEAHASDVNVISWNRLASCMLASGSDDGDISVRDLRLIQGDAVVAHFEYHKHPITSIEWSPHESSTLAVTSSDNQLTVWDLSLERDEEDEAEFKDSMKDRVNVPENLPPQLLFVHQGQKDLKELHWHQQIPGMLMSTAADGFNILMPTNLGSTLPSND
ncbi:transducin family protein / WD-40 repeat family protein [Wolffia australiana]